MKSLLNKSLSQFVVCIVAILILTIPLFYLLTKTYYAEEMRDVICAMSLGKPLPPLDLEEDIMVGMTLQYVLILVVLSLSLFLVMRFLTRRLWKPFDDTLQKIEQFNLEHSDVPCFMESDIKEFARLNRSLEKLMHKDKDTYNSQKEFTENASHELQTPIAVIKSKLDLLMQEDLTQQQLEIISQLYQTIMRMSRLNKSLLLLAKIENSQFKSIERLDLKSFIRNRLAVYSELYHRKIELFTDRADVSIKANSSLLESLIDNLVVNAIRNTSPEGLIDIILGPNTLIVENNCEGEGLDKQKIFQRFNYSNERKKGNGLGLAIVKAICDYHGWILTYELRDGRHTFNIGF